MGSGSGRNIVTTTFYRRRLPHLRVDGAVYFVTWRIRPGQPDLSDGERDEVVAAIRAFDGNRYVLHAYVVMNDHVHVILEPLADFRLEAILHAWKSFTANRLQRRYRRRDAVWQAESFDRVVRDEAEYEQKRDYIFANPFRRWPDIASYRWSWVLGLDQPEP
jgi:REP element-mobilizing transposase RayT